MIKDLPVIKGVEDLLNRVAQSVVLCSSSHVHAITNTRMLEQALEAESGRTHLDSLVYEAET